MMAASTLTGVSDVHGAAVFGALNSGLDGAAGQRLTPQAQAEDRADGKTQQSNASGRSSSAPPQGHDPAQGGTGSKKGIGL